MCEIRYTSNETKGKLQILLRAATKNKQTFCLGEHLTKEGKYKKSEISL